MLAVLFLMLATVARCEQVNQDQGWLVSLTDPGSDGHFCSATLLSSRHVITAAHCVTKSPRRNSQITVVLGVHGRRRRSQSQEVKVGVKKIILHPRSQQGADFALLELDHAIDFRRYPNISPICLPEDSNIDYTGELATVSIWDSIDIKSKQLQPKFSAASVSIMSHDTCKSHYPDFVTENMLCAGKENGNIDTCQGDSGGPLVCQETEKGSFELIGVFSWGHGCAWAGSPGVYGKVSKVLGWIKNTIGDDQFFDHHC